MPYARLKGGGATASGGSNGAASGGGSSSQSHSLFRWPGRDLLMT